MNIAFGHTAAAFQADLKTVTRRDWTARTHAAWCRAWDEGRRIHRAWDHTPRVRGAKPIGWLELSGRPYRERLIDMPEGDVPLEGGLWPDRASFLRDFGGDLTREVSVVRFRRLQEHEDPEHDCPAGTGWARKLEEQ